MSFSRSRKAAWQARISGDPFHLYSSQEEHILQKSLRREPSQLDLSLSIPSRPQRLIITDDELVDKYHVTRRHATELSKRTEELEKHADPTPFPQPPQDQSVFSPSAVFEGPVETSLDCNPSHDLHAPDTPSISPGNVLSNRRNYRRIIQHH